MSLKLLVAQGFGVGRVPVAPGTFGSLLGLVWFFLLLSAGSWRVFVIGNAAAIALSVFFCGEGEKALGRKDPGSVVLDEVAAMPVCFAAWMAVAHHRHGAFPAVREIACAWHGLGAAGTFLLFRFFDVLKPWPVNRSQSLPGGWGITVDDLLAAAYVNVLWLGLLLLI